VFKLSNYNQNLLKLSKKIIFKFSIQIQIIFKLKMPREEFYVDTQKQPLFKLECEF
jgi:hypothetical protein